MSSVKLPFELSDDAINLVLDWEIWLNQSTLQQHFSNQL